MSSKLKNVLLHCLCWAILFLGLNYILKLTFMGQAVKDGKTEMVIYQISITRFLVVGLFFKIIFFYFNAHFLLKNYIGNRRIIRYILFFLLSGITLFYLEKFTVDYYNKLIDRVPGRGVDDYAYRASILLYIMIAGASLFYFFSTEWIKNEKAKQLMKEEQLNNELSLLKYQLNPHFLFNTLNNLFSMAQETGNRQLSGSITKLAGLMRYMLYDSNRAKVLLDKEIAYLKDYIEVYRLRTVEEDDISINFAIEGETSNRYIAPMLLMPLIENAFKHGINYKEKSFINIKLAISDNSLFFDVMNSDHSYLTRSNDESSGIGLGNVKKRLELIYPNNYSLYINKENETYIVKLKVENLSL